MQVLGHTMVETQYVQARRLFRDFVVQVFGYPPEMLGILDNANRSTIESGEVFAARYSTEPAMDLFCDELNTWVVPQFGAGLFLSYPSPVPADKELARKVMVALPSAFYVDDIRALAGHKPLPEGTGKVLMVAPGAPRVPVEDVPSKAAPKQQPSDEEDDDTDDDEDNDT